MELKQAIEVMENQSKSTESEVKEAQDELIKTIVLYSKTDPKAAEILDEIQQLSDNQTTV